MFLLSPLKAKRSVAFARRSVRVSYLYSRLRRGTAAPRTSPLASRSATIPALCTSLASSPFTVHRDHHGQRLTSLSPPAFPLPPSPLALFFSQAAIALRAPNPKPGRRPIRRGACRTRTAGGRVDTTGSRTTGGTAAVGWTANTTRGCPPVAATRRLSPPPPTTFASTAASASASAPTRPRRRSARETSC